MFRLSLAHLAIRPTTLRHFAPPPLRPLSPPPPPPFGLPTLDAMFSSLAPERAPAVSKNVEDERLRHMHADVAEMLLANTTPRCGVRKARPRPRGAAGAQGALLEEEEAPVRRPVWAKVRLPCGRQCSTRQTLGLARAGGDRAADAFVWAADLTRSWRLPAPRRPKEQSQVEFALDAIAEVARQRRRRLS
ncbi:hypothetical protein ZWY2020_050193 [Hordeum vulgare]|nr:hypothetical protein ZWY2020_050193 [Hordeum vulgare]